MKYFFHPKFPWKYMMRTIKKGVCMTKAQICQNSNTAESGPRGLTCRKADGKSQKFHAGLSCCINLWPGHYAKTEPAHEKKVFITGDGKGSEKHVHKRSLARAFAVLRHSRDLEEDSGKKCLSVVQIWDCPCTFEEPQTGKPYTPFSYMPI